jgi:hypothetical protein
MRITPSAVEPGDYNYRHFTRRQLLADVLRTVWLSGIRPGEEAPDFTLPRADGRGSLGLHDLRGRPALLHFGSYT